MSSLDEQFQNYLDQAGRCREIAAATEFDCVRSEYLQMARTYEQMAAQIVTVRLFASVIEKAFP